MKSSGSNGVVDRGAQGIEGHIRALYLSFQERMKRDVDTREIIVTFLPEYAAYLMNRLEIGKFGKVAYERVKGKRHTVMGVEFGEEVLYKARFKQQLEKINARWEYGIFAGIRNRSNELWIATEDDQLIAVRSVKRIPVEQIWSKDNMKWVTTDP